MVNYTSQPVPFRAGRFTPRRVRLAGVAAMLGALVLFGHVAVLTAIEFQGLTPPWLEVGAPAYYVSEGVLILAWAGMLAGFAALRIRLAGVPSRFWRVGVSLATIGAAIATIGFVVVTLAPAVDAASVVMSGNAFIGIGLMVFINVGMLLMGIGLFRTGELSRVIAALLVLVLPANLIAGELGVALGIGPVVALLAIVPFVAAVVLLGEYLRTETPDGAVSTELDAAPSAEA